MSKVKNEELLYAVIYCAIVAFFYVAKPIEPLTVQGMRLLGVFFAAIFGWAISNSAWPSLVTIALLPTTEVLSLTEVIAAGWGTDIFVFIVLGFVLTAFMDVTGFGRFMASWLISRKILLGHPWRLLFMILFIAWSLAALVNVVAGMLITWGFVYQICDVLGYKPHDKFSNVVVFGVAAAVAVGLASFPWHGNALLLLAGFTKLTDIEYNMVHFLAYSLPYAIFTLLAYLLIAKFIFKLDVSKLLNLNMDFITKEDLEFTPERKAAFWSLVALIAFIIIPTLFPKGSTIYNIGIQLGLMGKALIIFGVLSIIRVDGKHIFNWHKLASTCMNWNLLAMAFAVLDFVSMLAHPSTGISEFLQLIVGPIFANVSPMVLIIVGSFMIVVVGNLMVTLVISVIIMTATFPVASSMGMDLTQLGYLYTLCGTLGILTPPASATSIVLFSNREWIEPKNIYKMGIPTMIIFAIIAIVWNLIYFAI